MITQEQSDEWQRLSSATSAGVCFQWEQSNPDARRPARQGPRLDHELAGMPAGGDRHIETLKWLRRSYHAHSIQDLYARQMLPHNSPPRNPATAPAPMSLSGNDNGEDRYRASQRRQALKLAAELMLTDQAGLRNTARGPASRL